MGASLATTVTTTHVETEVASAIQRLSQSGVGLILVLGASAIVDRADVIPAALEAAGGSVEIFRRDYMGEDVPLFPSYGNTRHARR